jgi:hypothetical protein
MDVQLTRGDIELILESLEYTKMNITHSKDSPYQLRRGKLDDVEAVMAKLRVLRDRSDLNRT